ncbi:MAG TPA: SGNH/GDSL hydrolase family protein [Actinomycetota bacterium]|nr:SGNH/GDSL hydrolase family protein [Actinomycetota bacterium]
MLGREGPVSEAGTIEGAAHGHSRNGRQRPLKSALEARKALLLSALVLAVLLGACQESRPTWDYVALGDSVPAGSGGVESYVSGYARFIEADAGVSVRVHNLARDGIASGDLSRALRKNERFRKAVEKAEIVTVTIGFNDIGIPLDEFVGESCGGRDNEKCFRDGLRKLKRNWLLILSELRRLTTGGSILIMTNDYSELPGNPSASNLDPHALQVFASYLEEANSHRCTVARKMDIPCADVYRAFNGSDGGQFPFKKGLLANDGIRPSAKGNRVIASLLRDFGYEALSQPEPN